MNNEKYNGWTNRPTWLVNLWMGDNFTEDAEEGITVDEDYIRECIVHQQIEMVEATLHTEATTWSGLIQDLIGGALAEVNYYELAEHYSAEVKS